MTEQLWAPVEGKYGRTRDGRKVHITGREGDAFTGVFCESALFIRYWTKSGRFWGNSIDHPASLIAEWSDDAPAEKACEHKWLKRRADGLRCMKCGFMMYPTPDTSAKPASPPNREAPPTPPASPLPEIRAEDLRKGDIVHVRMEVHTVRGTSIHCFGIESSQTIYVTQRDILAVEPRPPEPLKVGDRVRMVGSPKSFGTFLMPVDDTYCVVKSDFNDAPRIYALSDLERAHD